MQSSNIRWPGRPRCLGSSEDSLLQQLSSRISVVSGASSSSGARNGRINKHKIYNGNVTMTSSTQKEMNILLTNPSLPELCEDQKKNITTNGFAPLNTETDKLEPSDERTPRPLQGISKQVFASVAVSIGSMVVGFSSGYTSPALASMAQPDSTLNVTKQEESWIGSLMPLSALVGGMAGGPLIEIIGRKTTILGTAVPFIISWLLIALASNVSMLYVGRAIAGFCVGIASLCLPVYMGETVQAEVRGMLGLISTTFGNMGILVVFWAGMYLNWSHLAYFGSMIPIPFLICMYFIPETPRWYISKDKHKEARKALQWLRGENADISEELAKIEKNHIDAEKNSPNSIRELFTKSNVKPISISIGLMFFQQLSGINAVIFYTVNIFQDAGSTIDKNLSTIIVGVVNLGSTFIATALIDRLGRKILLYISASAMIVSLTVLGGFFYLRTLETTYIDVSNYGWLPLVSFIVFVVGFSLGYGPIPWLMMGEILPAKIRGPAASLATAFNWACTFIVTKTFNDLIAVLGTHGALWMFATVCFVSLFFVFFCVPETQGKSLEDIEKRFKGPVRRMSSLANLKPLPMAV